MCTQGNFKCDKYDEGRKTYETVTWRGGAKVEGGPSQVGDDIPRLDPQEGGSLLKVEGTFIPHP